MTQFYNYLLDKDVSKMSKDDLKNYVEQLKKLLNIQLHALSKKKHFFAQYTKKDFEQLKQITNQNANQEIEKIKAELDK